MRDARLTDDQIAKLIVLLDAGARDEASAKTLEELSFGPREAAVLRRLQQHSLVRSLRADSYSAPKRYWLSDAGAERAAREKAVAA